MRQISKLDRRITEPARAEILQWLYAYEEMKRGDLLKKMHIKSGTLSSHLKALEEGGYITILKKSPKVVKITPKGKKAFETLQKTVIQNLRKKSKK